MNLCYYYYLHLNYYYSDQNNHCDNLHYYYYCYCLNSSKCNWDYFVEKNKQHYCFDKQIDHCYCNNYSYYDYYYYYYCYYCKQRLSYYLLVHY